MIYDIAGLRVSLQNKCKYTDKFCAGYLSDDQLSLPDIVASVTAEEFETEKNASEYAFSDGYIENICLYRSVCKQLPLFNRMLLHAAVLEAGGEAYAFLGRSGIGKSTHTGLWMRYVDGVSIVNGDKPILQYKDGDFLAYGTPWMGKEGLGRNTVAPLKGLCFLEQAKENAIMRLTSAQCAKRIFSQVLFPSDSENAEKTLELLDTLVTAIPAYVLQCTISENAVRLSYEALTGKTLK